MARINGFIAPTTSEHRTCVINGKNALFHRWEERAEVLPPSLTVGGHGGGQIKQTYGIIEYESGEVAEVYPHDIRFTDNLHREYCFEREETT